MRRRSTAAYRLGLHQKTGGRCVYCGEPLENGWHVDHMIPLAKGGSNELANLAPACGPCNEAKGATPLRVWLVSRFRVMGRFGLSHDPAGGNVMRDLRREIAKLSADLIDARSAAMQLRRERDAVIQTLIRERAAKGAK